MSWQDPVALGLCLLLVVVALRLRKRFSKQACTSCGTAPKVVPPTRVAVGALRLGRRR